MLNYIVMHLSLFISLYSKFVTNIPQHYIRGNLTTRYLSPQGNGRNPFHPDNLSKNIAHEHNPI